MKEDILDFIQKLQNYKELCFMSKVESLVKYYVISNRYNKTDSIAKQTFFDEMKRLEAEGKLMRDDLGFWFNPEERFNLGDFWKGK